MDSLSYWQFIWPLMFVLCLIGGISILLRRYGLFGPSALPQAEKRLRIAEITHLDHKRKIVLLRCDAQDYLVLLSPMGDQIMPHHAPNPHAHRSADAA